MKPWDCEKDYLVFCSCVLHPGVQTLSALTCTAAAASDGSPHFHIPSKNKNLSCYSLVSHSTVASAATKAVWTSLSSSPTPLLLTLLFLTPPFQPRCIGGQQFPPTSAHSSTGSNPSLRFAQLSPVVTQISPELSPPEEVFPVTSVKFSSSGPLPSFLISLFIRDLPSRLPSQLWETEDLRVPTVLSAAPGVALVSWPSSCWLRECKANLQ